jgi:hypothetical protein
MKHLSLVMTLLLLATAGPACAQKIAPGLWENTMTMKPGNSQMDAAMARMQEEMARMTPEQRKMMEDMMARQGAGVSVAPGGAIAVRVCITPEQAARDEVPQPDSHCKQTSKERSGNTVRFKFVCTGERAGTGEGEYTFINDKTHKGRVVINTTARGKPERMEMEHSGRWLAAACGDVKPLQP